MLVHIATWVMHRLGHGVEVDEKKAKHYYELAAMMGHIKQGIILV